MRPGTCMTHHCTHTHAHHRMHTYDELQAVVVAQSNSSQELLIILALLSSLLHWGEGPPSHTFRKLGRYY